MDGWVDGGWMIRVNSGCGCIVVAMTMAWVFAQ